MASLLGQNTEKVEPYPQTPPTAPEEAAAGMQLLHGFRMQLIAAEPLVTDPVDICYDEYGRAYVAEMNDYPYTDKERHIPSQENPTDAAIGKVRLLIDSDDDGVFDRSTVFADGLSWPTGVACWKGGVYVTATPDLWYFKDHDGDGVADERRKVYTGFSKYNVQAVMNNPVWGLDNHLYISGSTNGGTITKVDDADFKPLRASRHDFRFDPTTETLELESGYGRYGNTFDDYGNRFVCNIRNPALHVVMPKRFIDRNPWLPPIDARQDICNFGEAIPVHRIAPVEQWRLERGKRWAAEEPDRHPETELLGGGVVTSSAGITVYRGDAYPAEFKGNVFVSDASSSLFYRLTLKPDGVTFKASRPDTGAEFCASPDLWTRFVNFENSPDGTLTALDMYREAIEHPWSIPEDIHDRIDLERGRDRGRIYRLLPPDEKFERRPTPKLGDLSSEELIAFLSHPNAWHRETAQRLIVERGAEVDVRTIARLVVALEESPSELGRIHALWTLNGLPGGVQNEVFAAAGDSSPAVRTQAYRVLSDYADEPGIAQEINAHFHGPTKFSSAPAMFWALLSLRNYPSPDFEPIELFFWSGIELEILPAAGRDRWLANAMLCGPVEMVPKFLSLALSGPAANSSELIHQLAEVAGAREEPQDLIAVLSSVAGPHYQPNARLAAAAGLAAGLKRQRLNLFTVVAASAELPDFAKQILTLAEATARDPEAELVVRGYALDLYRSLSFAKAVPVYKELLDPDAPLALQERIVTSLGSYDKPAVTELLIGRWTALSPSLKQKALEILLTRPSFLAALLDAVEDGTISPHLVTRARREFLVNNDNAGIASRAAELFGGRSDRNAVITRYTEAIGKLKPDVDAGHAVYQAFCMACHKKGEEGLAILGPNLSTVHGWDPGQLLTNILDPSREVSPAFIEYLVEKNDGTVIGGAILNETNAAVLLRRPDGSRLAVYRRDIKEVRNSGLSLMPEGLEAVISPQQMADLIAWLRN